MNVQNMFTLEHNKARIDAAWSKMQLAQFDALMAIGNDFAGATGCEKRYHRALEEYRNVLLDASW